MTAPDFAGVLAAHQRQGIACTCMAWSATIHSNREWTFDPGEHRIHVAAALDAEMVAAQAEAHVFVVRGQAGYAAGVYATLNDAKAACDDFLAAFSGFEITEPWYESSPGWWRLYFRTTTMLADRLDDSIEIVEHEVRRAALAGQVGPS